MKWGSFLLGMHGLVHTSLTRNASWVTQLRIVLTDEVAMTSIQNIVSNPQDVPHYHGRPMTMERLRRQVYTVGVWAHRCDQDVIEDWASKSVVFISEQLEEYAKKVAQLRADNNALRAKLNNIPVATVVSH